MSLFTIALIGNPNCGKTTLFNNLTGAHQKVGNWPGVTVEKKSGTMMLGDQSVEIVDLPGIYSLEQDYLGLDEIIARDFLRQENYDLVINIIDATNLERNLVLTQQVLEASQNVVVALNMVDVAQQNGVEIDVAALSKKLGVVVVPIVASRGTGVDGLKAHMQECLVEGKKLEPERSVKVSHDTDEATGDKLIRRYHTAKRLVDGVMLMTPVEHSLTEQIDRWVLNRWLGIPFFLFMMYAMFTVAISFGAVFIDFFDILFGAVFVDSSRWLLTWSGFPEWLVVLLADGLGSGIQLVATFIPVIGFLFLCLSMLEDSGYMSRAAFVVDRLMSKLGLPGNAFVPLIVGFGCNVPSVMASRTLGRDSDRLLTIAMAPFMSCGARLTVYALFAAAFFPNNGQNIVFLLYLLGIGMAVLTGWVFRKQIFAAEMTPSFQEMPAYHLPVVRNILLTTWFRLRAFVFRAGKTIVLVVIALSFLNSLGTDGSFGHANTDKSALSVVGKTITPLFVPIGLSRDNWPATVGLFTGLFAKEAVVGTLDALYSGSEIVDLNAPPDINAAVQAAFMSIVINISELLGHLGDPLGLDMGDLGDQAKMAEVQGVNTSTLTNMASLFGSQLAAFSYLVFILLYAPCVAVLGAIAKEAGWRWMALVFCWSTGLAYVTASTVYQLGSFSAHPLFSGLWLLGCVLVMIVAISSLKRIGQGALPANRIAVVQLG
ncbi:ferrous iron transport protein B [Pseudomonadales bacterium]|nr:ferrous iron transport protein B [Pseudomonadales bacterium]MDA9297545.1 ferrous iron transport protein B [Pseudomonadales bacterium]MDB9917676.1 ferrous iron transport protein B [Pseudomonadales bacterium]MDB9942682.1 ferrous iron transport protein B [Pseudomonadales bacterium]MDC0174233.1 ferrous iron transport protein B [Pseudomonadales bacterium]